MAVNPRRDSPRGRGGKSKNSDAAPRVAKPTTADFTGRAVNKAVLTQTLKSPFTWAPAVGSGWAVAWMAAFGMSMTGLLAAFGLAGLGATAWAVNFFFRGEKLGEAYANELREQMRQAEEEEFVDLVEESKAAGFEDGAVQGGNLYAAHHKLRVYLLENVEQRPVLARYVVHGEENFQEGLAKLQQGLDLFRMLQSVDVEDLAKEVKSWKRQLTKLDEDDADAKTLRQQIEEAEDQIALYHERQTKLAELVAGLSANVAALQNTALEVVDLGNLNPALIEGGAAERIENAVDAARRAEDKLLGRDDAARAEKEKFMRAADDEQRHNN